MTNPRLIIDISKESDRMNFNDFSQDLQRKVSEQYTVYPVMSYKSYELFETSDGSKKLIHESFVLGYRNPIGDLSEVHNLFLCLWGLIRTAWPEKSVVMWRTLPQVEIELDDEVNKLLILRTRLGSFSKCATESHKEGCFIKIVN